MIWLASVVVDAAAGVDGARLKRTAAARAAGMNARAPIRREIKWSSFLPAHRVGARWRSGSGARVRARKKTLERRGWGAAGAGPYRAQPGQGPCREDTRHAVRTGILWFFGSLF